MNLVMLYENIFNMILKVNNGYILYYDILLDTYDIDLFRNIFLNNSF